MLQLNYYFFVPISKQVIRFKYFFVSLLECLKPGNYSRLHFFFFDIETATAEFKSNLLYLILIFFGLSYYRV